MQGTIGELLASLAFTCVGAVGLSAASSGFLFNRLGHLEALILGITSILVLWPEPTTSFAGLLPMAGIGLWNRFHRPPAPQLQE
jgi:TRAP-type uncharacterized transport system fused permease subunit